MAAVEEFEAGAVDVDRLQRIHEAEQLRPVGAVELTELLDEGQHGRPDHDVVDHVGFGRDLREVARERALRRRDGDLRDHLGALRLQRRRQVVAMIVAEGEVREDHGDLLAGIGGDPRRHRDHLRFDVGNPRLEDVAVELGRGDVMAFADHVVGDFQLARRRRRADHHMREQRAVDHVGLVLGGELADHFGAALRIGAVILDDDLQRPAVDAAGIVDQLGGGVGGDLVPAAIGGADAGAVRLEADLDRLGARRLRIADEARRQHQAGGGTRALERAAAGNFLREQALCIAFFSHAGSPVYEHWPNVKIIAARAFRTAEKSPVEIACIQTKSSIPGAGNSCGMAPCRPLIRPSASTAARGRARCRRSSGSSAAIG